MHWKFSVATLVVAALFGAPAALAQNEPAQPGYRFDSNQADGASQAKVESPETRDNYRTGSEGNDSR